MRRSSSKSASDSASLQMGEKSHVVQRTEAGRCVGSCTQLGVHV